MNEIINMTYWDFLIILIAAGIGYKIADPVASYINDKFWKMVDYFKGEGSL